MLAWLVPFVLSMAATLILTPIMRRVAHATGMVAAPSADRWHDRSTALLGGVAIYGGFVIGGFATLLLRDRTLSDAVVSAAATPLGISRPWIGVFLAATLMFAVGLADDKLKLNPTTKLMFQAVAAAIVITFGVVYPLTPWTVVNVLATFFWLIALTNAMNLLDHMDGVAVGVAGIAALFLSITLFLDGAWVIAGATLALSGAAFGFLPYNFPRASIFMGDAGSMFLGSLLAGLGAAYPNRVPSASLIAVLFVPAMIVVIPIVDTLLVTTTRTLAGRSIAAGGRDHTSHRLIAMGFSERQVALTLYSIAIIGGLIALVFRSQPTATSASIAAIFLIALLLLVAYLGRMQPYSAATAQPGRVTLMVSDLVHKRRALEVVMDLVLFAVAYQLAYLLRWDGSPPAEQETIFAATLAVAVAVKSGSFALFGVYRGNWHFLTISDAGRIARATLFGTLLTTAALVFFFREYHFARGILIIDGLLVAVLTAGARASFRSLDLFRHSLRRGGSPTLVYGAGSAGALAVREMISNPALDLKPLAFIDDDPRKVGSFVQGYPVISPKDAGSFVRRNDVRTIVVGVRELSAERVAHLSEVCAGSDLRILHFRVQFEEGVIPPRFAGSHSLDPFPRESSGIGGVSVSAASSHSTPAA
jgi:UDP-GlcNAc:undecaprenyl-phosphate/decaprenyl-phosphate GlcNAc-1-phosphate transferase